MREKIARKIAWLLPRRVAYWCAVRVMAHATTGEYSGQVVPELTAADALKRWPDRRRRVPPGVVVNNYAPRQQPGG